MPRFYEYVETEVDLDISVEDFLDECDSSDIEDIIKRLNKEGYLTSLICLDDDNKSLIQIEMEENLTKILNNRHNLTMEEEEIIKKIASKF